MSQTPSCRTCGASLAPDQRYCLSCGTRVAAPRLDFLAESERREAEALVAAPAAVAAGAPAPAPSPSGLDKIGGPMGVAAVVLVALGIGFLVGQGRDDEPPAQRAPVVNVQGGGLPSSDTATATSDAPAADDPEATATSDAPAADDPEATATR